MKHLIESIQLNEVLDPEVKKTQKEYLVKITPLIEEFKRKLETILKANPESHTEVFHKLTDRSDIYNYNCGVWDIRPKMGDEACEKLRNIFGTSPSVSIICTNEEDYYEGVDYMFCLGPSGREQRKENMWLKINRGKIVSLTVGPVGRERKHLDLLGKLNVIYSDDPQISERYRYKYKSVGRSITISCELLLTMLETFTEWCPKALEAIIEYDKEYLKTH